MIPEHEGEVYHLRGAELIKANDFRHEHNKKHGTYLGAIGGRYSVMFTGTSVGTAVHIVCGQCKEEADVTEYDDW